MARRRAENDANEERQRRAAGLVVRSAELLDAIPDSDEPSISRYFASDDDADEFFGPDSVERAPALAGAWADLDWDEAEVSLRLSKYTVSPPDADKWRRHAAEIEAVLPSLAEQIARAERFAAR